MYVRSWPSLTAEGATTNGGHAIHCGRCWLERPLYDAPLPLVANNWPALDDPKASVALFSVERPVHFRNGRSPSMPRNRSSSTAVAHVCQAAIQTRSRPHRQLPSIANRRCRPTAVLHVAQIGARNLPFSGENNGAQRVAAHPHPPVSNVSAHTASSSSALPLASRRSSVSASRTVSSSASSSAHRRCRSAPHPAARA